MKTFVSAPQVVKKSLLVLMGAAVALLPAAGAKAEPRTHDGFFLQMDLGAGGMVAKTDFAAGEFEASGGAGEFSIAVGGAVSRNLILAGHVWAVATEDPDLKVNGHDIGSADATMGLSGVGLNVTYYTPSNFYFSATPSVTVLTVETDGEDYETDAGFGVRVAIGKEWWVGDEWGLGLNGQFAFSSNEDEGETWTTTWVGVAFSATFN